MESKPVFSAREVEYFEPVGSGRTYTIAPLSYRERTAFRSDMAREGGLFPTRPTMLAAMRASIEAISPGNAAELLEAIDAAEAAPNDLPAQIKLLGIETVCAIVPTYADLLAARERYMGALPYVACKHGLRGWSGPELPPFRQERGMVPDDLLNLLPEEEMRSVGYAINRLMTPQAAAEGNSGSRSPSRANPSPATGASSRKTAAAGRSRAKSTKATRA